MPEDNITEILTEEIDEEILSRMPLWFRILRNKYMGMKKSFSITNSNRGGNIK